MEGGLIDPTHPTILLDFQDSGGSAPMNLGQADAPCWLAMRVFIRCAAPTDTGRG